MVVGGGASCGGEACGSCGQHHFWVVPSGAIACPHHPWPESFPGISMGIEKTGHETGVVPGVASVSGGTSVISSTHPQALSDWISQGFAGSRERPWACLPALSPGPGLSVELPSEFLSAKCCVASATESWAVPLWAPMSSRDWLLERLLVVCF